MTDRYRDFVYPYLCLFLLSLYPSLLFFPVAETPALQNGQAIVYRTTIEAPKRASVMKGHRYRQLRVTFSPEPSK